MEEFEETWAQNKQQYTDNVQELQSIIKVIPTVGSTQRYDYEQQGQDCLRKIGSAISDLTLALRPIRSSQKDQYRHQLNAFKTQLKSLNNDFEAALQKQSLNSYSTGQKEERQALLLGNEIIDSTQESLDRSKQLLAETEDIAMDTASKVDQQGLQLESVLQNVNEINDTSERARRIARGMARRVYTDRYIQCVIVFLEIGIVGGLLYWKFGT